MQEKVKVTQHEASFQDFRNFDILLIIITRVVTFVCQTKWDFNEQKTDVIINHNKINLIISQPYTLKPF